MMVRSRLFKDGMDVFQEHVFIKDAFQKEIEPWILR